MPTIEQNQSLWNGGYDWSQAGAEWSRRFGNPEAQWWASLMPRIHSFVPADTILEIAPGFGRWSQFLAPLSRRLILVDLSEECVAACRQRFAGDASVSCHVNDGRSLAVVPDRSVDFVFSFDSLVHVEADVIGAYLSQIAMKLKTDGVAFIHHSNLGQYAAYYRFKRALPKNTGPFLQRIGLMDNDGFRGITMTADRFRRLAADAGLVCTSQEIVTWGSRRLIDCFSIVTRPDSRWARETKIVRNPRFGHEASYIRGLSGLYVEATR